MLLVTRLEPLARLFYGGAVCMRCRLSLPRWMARLGPWHCLPCVLGWLARALGFLPAAGATECC